MIPSTMFLRTARMVFPAFARVQNTQSIGSRYFASMQMAKRPTVALMERVKESLGWGLSGRGQEQVRGMKVRSSVKKLCEGCKVCCVYFWGFWVLGCAESGGCGIY
ncbi:hypothetical protein OCU04_001010 [Sclerotinia nivalis]|uniref:Uncharacterized protein n=1 Tax=Sclerotinia nivalis TaxID=352851 RepID=A0A9X0DPB2_9HELO|nr:hypothetical protein OCU04_001010 [Sclerotinia nivalis]